MIASTKTDIAADAWSIDDRVLRLHEWGTKTIHVLPQPLAIGLANVTIGAAETCSIRLLDPTGRVSRLHASLVQHGATRWLLHDLGSKNGTRLNGARCRQIGLEAGDEIGIGGITLIAESRRSVALRGFSGGSSDGGTSSTRWSTTRCARSAWPRPGASRSCCAAEATSCRSRARFIAERSVSIGHSSSAIRDAV